MAGTGDTDNGANGSGPSVSGQDQGSFPGSGTDPRLDPGSGSGSEWEYGDDDDRTAPSDGFGGAQPGTVGPGQSQGGPTTQSGGS